MEKKTLAVNFALATIFHIAAFAFLAFIFAKSTPFPEIDKSVITVMLVSPQPATQQTPPPQPQQTPPTPREQQPRQERITDPEAFTPRQEEIEITETEILEEISEHTQESSETSEIFVETGEISSNTDEVAFSQTREETVVQFTEAPRAIFMPQVPYPRAARAANITGTAEIAYIIDVVGRVRSVEILSMPPHPSFEATIRRTVMSWRFTPAKKDGVPVQIRATQTIVFELQG